MSKKLVILMAIVGLVLCTVACGGSVPAAEEEEWGLDWQAIRALKPDADADDAAWNNYVTVVNARRLVAAESPSCAWFGLSEQAGGTGANGAVCIH